MGFFSGITKAITNAGDAIADVAEGVSDVVEDAWKNDVVRGAVIGTGLYYGGSYLYGALNATGTATASTAASSTGSSFLGPILPEEGLGPWALNKARGVVRDTVKGYVKDAIGGGSSGASGGGSSRRPSVASVRQPSGSSPMYRDFRPTPANLGFHPKVAIKMQSLVNPRMPNIVATTSEINRKASSRTLNLGSSKFGKEIT